MSIEVNGVTLPDIPSEVLEQYPYAVILDADAEASGAYFCACTTTPCVVYTPGFDAYVLANISTAVCSCLFTPGGTSWEIGEETTDSNIMMPVDPGTTPETVFPIVWANYDIYLATANDDGSSFTATDTIYFARNDSDPNYFAPKSWFDNMARQVMRLTGTSDKLNTDKMLELAKGVEVGGGGGLTFETSASGTTS